MRPSLIEKLRTYIEFNDEEERFISSVFKLKSFTKGEHFLLAGDVCREAAFIESGVFRFISTLTNVTLLIHWGTAFYMMVVAFFLLRRRTQ